MRKPASCCARQRGTADEYALLTPFGTAFRYDDASDPDEAELDVNMAISCAAETLL